MEAHHGNLSLTSDGVSEATFVVDLPTTAAPITARPAREETLRGERG